MKIKDMPIEELELMSLTDITYIILKEKKKPMSTADLFKEISKLLDLSESDFASKIGDYYTSLNIDKRFVLLDNNEWDIRDNHSVEIVMDEEDEEEVEEEEIEEEVEEETEEENIDEIIDDDLEDDDLEDLSIVDDEEEEDE
jgi:DNA-directed RNA polymerase subunit delta